MPTRSPNLLPVSEAAKYLSKRLPRAVDQRTLNRWALAGHLEVAWKAPGLRGRRYFTQAELDRFAAEHQENGK